ncbi:MAG: hypothetical protein QM706_16085 [Nitrospira sp.]
MMRNTLSLATSSFGRVPAASLDDLAALRTARCTSHLVGFEAKLLNGFMIEREE